MSVDNGESISFAQILEESCVEAGIDTGIVLIGEALRAGRHSEDAERLEISWETEPDVKQIQQLSGFVKEGIVRAFKVKAAEPIVGHLAFTLSGDITPQKLVNGINQSPRVFVPFMETGISTKIR